MVGEGNSREPSVTADSGLLGAFARLSVTSTPVPDLRPVPPPATPVIVPPDGPYWAGDPEVVPSPAVIRRSPVLSAASVIGGSLWLALVNTYAAQRVVLPADRERFSQERRNKDFSRAFIAANQARFAPNDTGGPSADQFHLGVLVVPAILSLALAAGKMDDIPRSAFLWFRPPGVDPDPGPPGPEAPGDGYCYTQLVPKVLRSDASQALGSWPSAAALDAWFADRGRKPLARVRARRLGGRLWHVLPPGVDGGPFVALPSFPGAAGTITLPYDALLGGDPPPPDPGRALDAALGDREMVLRIVFAHAVASGVPVARLPAVAELARTWRSVVLTGVAAQVVGDSTEAVFYVGLSHPNFRSEVALAATNAEAVLSCEVFASVGAASAEAGRQTVSLPLGEAGFDLELSDYRTSEGAQRPDLRVVWSPAGEAHAVLYLRFRVGAGAMLRALGSEAFAAGAHH